MDAGRSTLVPVVQKGLPSAVAACSETELCTVVLHVFTLLSHVQRAVPVFARKNQLQSGLEPSQSLSRKGNAAIQPPPTRTC